MNIALLTIWHIGNYGAELQTYCTIETLKKMGHRVRAIRYDLKEVDNSTTPAIKQFIYDLFAFLMPASIKSYLFWRNYIPSTIHYHDIQELYNNPPIADAYIVGSDQVWNPDITRESAPIYFLNFGGKEIRRISYASSFGNSEWKGSKEVTDIAKKQLNSFFAISTRESTGVEILKKEFGLTAKCVLDPTLLLDNYKQITGNIKGKNTLLYYPLSNNSEVFSFCEELSKELRLKFKLANRRQYIYKTMLWNKPSVKQWLRNIGEAKFVITPSFHGLTTSLKLHRNFAILITEPLIIKRSSRIKDLLNVLNLSNRLFTSIDDLRNSRIWEQNIDYVAVDKILDSLREESLVFLKDSLK